MARETRDWSLALPVDSGPTPGYYAVRLKEFCPRVAARVWLDWPRDDDGRIADRPRRLACKINGEWAPLHTWWRRMHPISREEYERLAANPPADPWTRTTRSNPNGDQSGRVAAGAGLASVRGVERGPDQADRRSCAEAVGK